MNSRLAAFSLAAVFLWWQDRSEGKTNLGALSGASPHMRGAFGGGSVRVREPRPEPMRKGVNQLKPGVLIMPFYVRTDQPLSPSPLAREHKTIIR
jgi:hypothetical protein